MKKFAAVAIVVVAFALVPVLVLLWWTDSTSSVSNSSEKIRFIVPKGEPAQAIGEKLENEGIIKDALAFKIYLQITDKSKSINSGEFMLSPDMTLFEVIELLGQSPTELWVTIPEGYRREEVAEKVADDLGVENRPQFVQEFLLFSEGLEGYLFPDTYLFPRDVTPQKVIDLLTATFESKYDQALDENALNIGETDALTMASIIERETITKDERPVVSGILWTRLEENWPLQVDATAQYVWGTIRCEGDIDCDWWIPPTRADLEVDSPYNTYVVNSLPPGPIANPGYDSIYASLHPKESEYLYYIHDPSGVIHYARTLQEHNTNISRYLN